MKKMPFALTIAILLLGLSLSVQAATKTTTMQVQATVPELVTVSANNLDFGEQPAGAPVKYVQTQILVTAPYGLPYNIAIDRGLHYGNNLTNIRQLKHPEGAWSLSYMLCKDNGYIQEWGDSDYANTYPFGSSLSATGTGSPQTHTVYGKLGQLHEGNPPGVYTDTVTITVHY